MSIGSITAQDVDVYPVALAGDYSVSFHATNVTFTADATSMLLQFEGTRGDVDNSVLIDDVRIAVGEHSFRGMVLIVR